MNEENKELPEMESFRNMRKKYFKNPLMGSFNINNLRNKITDLREIVKYLELDYYVIRETKIDESFTSQQFAMNNFGIRSRKDRDCHGGGLLEFVRKGFICKRQTHPGPNNLECICSKLTISNIKWISFSIYGPPNSQNLVHFFNELSDSLSKANESYENYIVIGDFNIDIGISNSDHDKLEHICSLFDLKSLIKKETCITKTHPSTIDLILTNKPLSFQSSNVIEIGLSDHRKPIATFVKSHFTRLNPNTVYYRNFKNFNENSFLNDLRETNFDLSTNDPNENYCFITDIFIKIAKRHAPLKKRFFRGNQAPFMNKELRKAIYSRSRLRNNCCKNPTKENEKKHKIQRNKCVSVKKKSIKKYFKNISKDNVVTNKNFWSVIKPFPTDKGHINGEEIILKCDNETITESSLFS